MQKKFIVSFRQRRLSRIHGKRRAMIIREKRLLSLRSFLPLVVIDRWDGDHRRVISEEDVIAVLLVL